MKAKYVPIPPSRSKPTNPNAFDMAMGNNRLLYLRGNRSIRMYAFRLGAVQVPL